MVFKKNNMDEDKIIKMLLKHDEDIAYIKEKMATKDDFREMSKTLDKLVRLAEKKGRELTVHAYQIKNLSDDVASIKPLVGLA
jgi:predicted Zn-ribbon and HTH transcriptional regulator